MSLECRKCPYFVKEKDKFHGGTLIRGFCKLRQKHISDTSITSHFCKDRATID